MDGTDLEIKLELASRLVESDPEHPAPLCELVPPERLPREGVPQPAPRERAPQPPLRARAAGQRMETRWR